MPWRPALLVLYLAATLAAFGGIYSWAIAPVAAGALLIAAVASRIKPAAVPDTRGVDLALAALTAALFIQLIPLPVSMRDMLSPHAAEVERILRPDAAIRDVSVGSLSIDPAATATALTVLLSTVVTYIAARRIFTHGGVRWTARALAVIGTIAAVGALAQRALTPTLIYGVWSPKDPGGLPFGPVVNRNHFAAWLLMVGALSGATLLVRVISRLPSSSSRSWQHALVAITQPSTLWTMACWIVITAATLAAQSRSALLGLFVAAGSLLRGTTRGWRPLFIALASATAVVVTLFAIGESMTTRVAARLADTLEVREIDRVVIWRESLPMLADFPVTGVGAGAFERAMLTYQQTRAYVPHLGMEWHFNHAHNHYLHVAVEGGLLVTLPFLASIVLFLRVALRRLREDRGELRMLRLGALAGLAGIATQSIWEVPLTMPAAALLAATLAAIATFRRAS